MWISPAMHRRTVVLPQPDGPNSIVIPVAGTENTASSVNFPSVLRNSAWISCADVMSRPSRKDFDIQATISQQYPFAALASPGFTAHQNLVNFGDPVLINTAFQYHIFEYLWPQLEVNYEYWPNGEHQHLSQVLLTPGIIFGRFKIGMDTPTRPINLIFGAGYQFSVTSNPVIAN